ncbi:threonine/serine dehydratase [Nitrospirillum sp. BR 11163]|uniref:threonine ammonia-lyase n=1 Tax=Nitrospirillum sp. BR 11163 TaxID=3104323 RepID=UPI002AFFDBE9|nr:threonine/serine dehydratase [Nitrospirillum sp. BR 11163]MEA1674490.1 threonine/serine dehydratase [Nitrospirillum sp. BR 11163]
MAMAVTGADVEAAAELLAGKAVATPLITNAALDAAVGARVLLKPEVLQRTGSFKFRGAYNRLGRLTAEERARGVVAWSSGNHAQGVAEAARLVGTRATIVMPADAPAIKVAGTRALGAEIVFYDRYTQDREVIGRDLSARTGAVLVPSYDDVHIIAGQGTVGLEIGRQAAALGLAVDACLVNCSGGGLATGTALGLKQTCPQASVHTVEPEGFDDMARSLVAGERVANAPGAKSSCDALLAPIPGTITFPLAQALLGPGLVVTEAEVRAAMRFAAANLKLVVESGGAAALAALLSGKVQAAGRTIAVVLSGGNVDPAFYAEVLAEAA